MQHHSSDHICNQLIGFHCGLTARSRVGVYAPLWVQWYPLNSNQYVVCQDLFTLYCIATPAHRSNESIVVSYLTHVVMLSIPIDFEAGTFSALVPVTQGDLKWAIHFCIVHADQFFLRFVWIGSFKIMSWFELQGDHCLSGDKKESLWVIWMNRFYVSGGRVTVLGLRFRETMTVMTRKPTCGDHMTFCFNSTLCVTWSEGGFEARVDVSGKRNKLFSLPQRTMRPENVGLDFWPGGPKCTNFSLRRVEPVFAQKGWPEGLFTEDWIDIRPELSGIAMHWNTNLCVPECQLAPGVDILQGAQHPSPLQRGDFTLQRGGLQTENNHHENNARTSGLLPAASCIWTHSPNPNEPNSVGGNHLTLLSA